jgi:hypothetical protein
MPIDFLLIKQLISLKGIAVLGSLRSGAAQPVCNVMFANSWTLHLTCPPLKTQVICATHPSAGANFSPRNIPYSLEKSFLVVDRGPIHFFVLFPKQLHLFSLPADDFDRNLPAKGNFLC